MFLGGKSMLSFPDLLLGLVVGRRIAWFLRRQPRSLTLCVGAVQVEAGELRAFSTLSRSEVSRIKAFIRRTTDRFRLPYGKRLIESPRQCVFAGTANHSNYLRDNTGARRFWPVLRGAIDIDAFAHGRDRFWAEAKDRFDRGSVWRLETNELVTAAAGEQAARFESDPWEELIEQWINTRASASLALSVPSSSRSKQTAFPVFPVRPRQQRSGRRSQLPQNSSGHWEQ